MLIEQDNNIFFKILKLGIFWFALASMLTLLYALYEYELKKPAIPTSLDLNIRNKINICTVDPYIDRQLYSHNY